MGDAEWLRYENLFFADTIAVLSHWTDADSALAESLWGDPQVSRYLCVDGVFTKEGIATRLALEIQNQTLYGVQYWPLFFQKTGDLAGCCGLRPFDSSGCAFEFGIHLRPLYWGHGIATEAGHAALAFARENIGLSEIVAGHHPENRASQKVLQKLGFTYLKDSFYAPTGLMHPAYRLQQTKG